MAGIGFKLQKLLVEEMYLSLFQGFFYALVITSGPWLIMVISLSVLMVFSRLLNYDLGLFNFLLVHIFAITIIITGVFQVFFTRVFADKMYTKERDELPKIIMTNLVLTLLITAVLLIPFLWFVMAGLSFAVQMLTFGLFLTVTVIWVLINYVSASESFMTFIKHYGIGCVISIVVGVGLAYSLNGFRITDQVVEQLGQPSFVVKDATINRLRGAGLPEDLLTTLDGTKNITIRGREAFLQALGDTIGAARAEQYQDAILDAIQTTEVPTLVLTQLQTLQGQTFTASLPHKLQSIFTLKDPAEQAFLNKLRDTIGPEQTASFRALLLRDANTGLYMSGFLAGFLLGQAYIALVLFVQIIKIFGFPAALDFSVLRTFSHYHVFLLSGFFLNAGLWVDKFLYSYGPLALPSFKPLYWDYIRAAYNYGAMNLYTLYTDPFYLAYLSTTPILALFFISMETSFYTRYYAYNKAMVNRARLGLLRRLRGEIIDCVRDQLGNIIKVQSIVIVLCILFSAKIITFLNISEQFALSFNIIVFGAFFHIMFLIICITLLYYDLRTETMQMYAAFFILNTVLTVILMGLGWEQYLGLGYTAAALLVFAYSFYPLKVNLKDINYLSFTRQKMAEEKIEHVFIKGNLKGTGAYGRYYIKDGERLIDA
jgi:uncharacterized membrane protein